MTLFDIKCDDGNFETGHIYSTILFLTFFKNFSEDKNDEIRLEEKSLLLFIGDFQKTTDQSPYNIYNVFWSLDLMKFVCYERNGVDKINYKKIT